MFVKLGALTPSSGLTIDIDRLIRTRLFIQASSGGGKSHTLRLLLERSFDAAQHIVIDSEGEFGTLRQKFPYLVGAPHGGDFEINVRSAGLLARRLRELGQSVILDIFEMVPDERCEFVAAFISSLVDCPRNLWGTPALVAIDEVWRFCLDNETEVLTPRGWLPPELLQVGDIVVAFDPKTGQYNNEPISDVIRQVFDGEMVRIKGKTIDKFVTPDHRIVYSTQQRGQKRPDYLKWSKWGFRPAGDLPGHFRIPAGGAPEGPGLPLSNDFLRLLGWVMTDGSVHSAETRSITLSQAKSTKKFGKLIAKEMSRTVRHLFPSATITFRKSRSCHFQGAPIKCSDGIEIYFGVENSKELFKWLYPNNIHRIHRAILSQATHAQLQTLLMGLMEGDGGEGKHGKLGTFTPGGKHKLAEDFQELATRLGIRTVLKRKKIENYQDQSVVYVANDYNCHELKRNANITREEFSGPVWDITVPSGAFVARRRGTTFVTGNCPQSGTTEASKPIKALSALGRKRRLGLIATSQRISKVDKDMVGELLNVLIGKTSLDNDIRRAAEILGFSFREAQRIFKVLPGGDSKAPARKFFGFGPAFSQGKVFCASIDDTITKAPDDETGSLEDFLPPPPDAVRELLSRFSDIGQLAERELRTIENYREEVRKLRQEVHEKANAMETMLTRAEADKRIDEAVKSYVQMLNKMRVRKAKAA